MFSNYVKNLASSSCFNTLSSASNNYILCSLCLQENDKEDNSSLEQRHFMSLLLERRSLNILTEDMYSKYLHGIAERNVDFLDSKVINLDSCFNVPENKRLLRDTRVSLTIRYVPKVLNVKLKFGKK